MVRMPTDRERWQRLQSILIAALEQPAAARSAFLADACENEPALRAQVEALLAADQQTDTFLDTPLAEAAAALIDELGHDIEPPADPLVGHQLGPYQMVRRAGAGGMGEVYEAFDERLERRVAVKLLPAGGRHDTAAKRRFLREARAASALDHPNLCAIYDLGETELAVGGEPRLFLVLAYYEGETLERRIARGPLEIGEAREIALQVARGLERAHRAGIVHRDVKPANVMVTAGGEVGADAPDRVKLLDFGIAKMVGDAGLTRTGTSPGTPAYMSPEQLRGEVVDGRTDVWSLAVVLYEMVAGQRPFRGESQQAVTHAILAHEPEPLGRARAGVPVALAGAVAKALAKDPGERYPHIGAFLADLEAGTAPRARPTNRAHYRLRAAAAALLLGLVIAAGWWAATREGAAGRRASRQAAGRDSAPSTAAVASSADSVETVPVVGVVPLVNRTGNATLDWVGAGIARLVSDDLARSRHLHVVSERRLAALADAGPRTALAQRAAESGIALLLSGEILPDGDGFTVAARLEETESGRQRTARRVDDLVADDLLRAADDLAREARKGLGVPPTEAVDVFAADFAASHPAAYERFVEGLRALADYQYSSAEQAFRDALERAPDFVMARYRLAQVQAVTSRTDEALVNIHRAVTEAERLAERERRYIRAAEAYISRRYDEAIEAYEQILAFYPYETEARLYLAQLLHAQRRYSEELEVLQALARLEPENHITWSMQGEASLALGDTLAAAQSLRRYVELEPGKASGYHSLGNVYRAQGELELAAAEYAQALRLDPGFHFASIDLAEVDVLRERPDQARARLVALADDPSVAARFRIDAAFELAALARAEGRFLHAAEILDDFETLIASEGVREAMALSIRGTSLMELGELDAAAHLIKQAVERAPGTATRYLFARGLLELRQERYDALEETARAILRGSPSVLSTDRTREKAAAYLRGLRHLAQGQTEEAVDALQRAVLGDGYAYCSYRLGLARAYLAAGRWREALAAAHQAAERKPATPRLDLELDRNRALLVMARVHAEMGRPAAAAAAAGTFLERWASADHNLPELREARRLATVG